MKLKVLNSNSEGNAYILENDRDALLIECGVRLDFIKQALNYRISKVAGCIITHSHKDHCKSVGNVLGAGIKVYSTPGELSAMGIQDHHNAKPVSEVREYAVGSFFIKPFRIIHDTPEPVGYLIHHKECGTVLFLTDTMYSPFTFAGLNNIIIEANYCEEILQSRTETGSTHKFLRDRTMQSHMSLQNCKELLQANDLTRVNNIVLIHLSNNHSSEEQIKNEIFQATGKNITIADRGTTIDFNKTPF